VRDKIKIGELIVTSRFRAIATSQSFSLSCNFRFSCRIVLLLVHNVLYSKCSLDSVLITLCRILYRNNIIFDVLIWCVETCVDIILCSDTFSCCVGI